MRVAQRYGLVNALTRPVACLSPSSLCLLQPQRTLSIPTDIHPTTSAVATSSVPSPQLHIILYNPGIPQNVGNIGRMCAVARCRLHLIEPMPFTITDASLKRAGMDYWKQLDVHQHRDWNTFLTSPVGPLMMSNHKAKLWLLTTKTQRSLWDATFVEGDGLIFGSESNGVPTWMHESVVDHQRLTIPRFDTSMRSLNLATSAGIATYEALRQITSIKSL
jgi:tRNA (cytidine/uridine-2'-O-)-methyltransferase